MLIASMMRSLPTPTDSQCHAFIRHLVTVHSWHKHLPLFTGGEFIVFLAPDAGDNYPRQHPRLPTENTPDGYRRAFGYLDYIYRCNPNEPFSRDAPPPLELDSEIAAVGKLKLHPYVSHEMYWSVHENDVARIRDGAYHSDADAIITA